MKVALIQMTSVLDYKANLEKIRSMLKEIKKEKVEYVFLPECFYSMSNGLEPTPYLVNGNDEHYQNIKSLAADFEIAILGGTAAAYGGGDVVNRAFNFNSKGKDLGHYDKMHLFSCEIEQKGSDKKIINESDIYTPGDQAKMVEIDSFKIGMGVCFDIRYPEMSRNYIKKGANVLTFSSAFTVPTGRAHWHILNRARAIENQCFVISAAQWGKNNDRIQTYGHSLVIDPWGEVLVDAEEGEKVVYAEIDLSLVEDVRKRVKVF